MHTNVHASPPTSRPRSSNSSQTTGKAGGSLRTQRRTSRLTTRNGPTSVPGRWKSLRCSRAWKATKDSSSRTRLPTMPSLPNSPRSSTTRVTPWLSSTRSSSKVRGSCSVVAFSVNTLTSYRWLGVRWCVHEAAPGQQGPSRRGILE